jgi:hypothetical protein
MLGLTPSIYGLTITFDNADQFSNHFVEGASGDQTVWTTDGLGGGFLTSGGASSYVFNINDNSAAGLNRAAADFDNPRNLYGGTNPVIFTADFRVSGKSGSNSLGFYTKVPDATGQDTPFGGFAILFRAHSNSINTASDIRFWEYSDNVSGNDVHTRGLSTLTNTETFSGTTLDANEWYTARLEMQDIGSGVQFNASLLEIGGAEIGSTTWTSGVTAGQGPGQWGLRFNLNNTMDIDNVSVSVIPEPGTLVLLTISLVSALLFFRRRL